MEIREFWVRYLPSGRYVVQGAYECMNCNSLSVATVPQSGGSATNLEQADHQISTQAAMWAPETVTGREFPDAPEHIAKAADEAYRSSSIGAFMGATILARAAIEATAKAKGISQGTLYSKIDQMVTQGVIRRVIADGAHEVRHLGNDMAHGDIEEPVEREDVEDVLELMSLVLQEAFETEARVRRVRQRRTGAPTI